MYGVQERAVDVVALVVGLLGKKREVDDPNEGELRVEAFTSSKGEGVRLAILFSCFTECCQLNQILSLSLVKLKRISKNLSEHGGTQLSLNGVPILKTIDSKFQRPKKAKSKIDEKSQKPRAQGVKHFNKN
jgi:hypothetical protein